MKISIKTEDTDFVVAWYEYNSLNYIPRVGEFVMGMFDIKYEVVSVTFDIPYKQIDILVRKI